MEGEREGGRREREGGKEGKRRKREKVSGGNEGGKEGGVLRGGAGEREGRGWGREHTPLLKSVIVRCIHL